MGECKKQPEAIACRRLLRIILAMYGESYLPPRYPPPPPRRSQVGMPVATSVISMPAAKSSLAGFAFGFNESFRRRHAEHGDWGIFPVGFHFHQFHVERVADVDHVVDVLYAVELKLGDMHEPFAFRQKFDNSADAFLDLCYAAMIDFSFLGNFDDALNHRDCLFGGSTVHRGNDDSAVIFDVTSAPLDSVIRG